MATFLQSGALQNRSSGGQFSSGRSIRLTANVERVQGSLRDFIRNISKREPVNRKLALQFLAWVEKNFSSGGDLQSPKWAPLKESTRREKERKGYSPLPLTRTGALRSSFFAVFDDDRAGVRSDNPVGLFHQTGTSKMPQRSMLPPEEYVRDTAVKIYGLHATDSIKRAGLNKR